MSSDACYSARSSTRTQVLEAIKRLTLSKNSSEQYNHDDAVKYFAAIKRVLKETYNPGDPGHGMEKLIDENRPGLAPEHPTNATSTFTTTAQDVLTLYLQRAATLNAQNLTTNVQPLITDRTEAQDHADRLNLQNQAVIGAKEGATEAIVLQFGRDITDSVLKTADGVDFKGIDEYHLFDVVQTCIQGADRPATGDILAHLVAVISTRFDFRKKIINNVEALRAKTARLRTYGINMDDTQIALIIIANVEAAATHEYGEEFKIALQTIRRRYNYSHVHDTASIAVILAELAAADAVRQLKDAPAPSKGTANAVAEQFSAFAQLLQGATYGTSSDDDGTAAAASDSDDTRATKRGRKKDKKKGTKKSKKREKSRSRSRPRIKHKCPHCKAQKRTTPHPEHVSFEKCNWNPAYKGFRQAWVCKIMKVTFKPRKEFTPELGGYARNAQSSSDDSSSSSGSESS